MGGLYFTTMSTRVAGKETQRTIIFNQKPINILFYKELMTNKIPFLVRIQNDFYP